MSAPDEDAPAVPRGRGPWVHEALVLALLVAIWWLSQPFLPGPDWGWDETMHAELPAARMALLAGRGEVGEAAEVLVGCSQYPFVVPVLLAVPQVVLGVSQDVARGGVHVLFVLAILGTWLAARAVARDLYAACHHATFPPPPPTTRGRSNEGAIGCTLLPFFSAALVAASPLARRYANTLFLEVPFLCTSAFALWLWLGRRRHASALRDVLAGIALTVVFFTKFNYGALFLIAIAADGALTLFADARRGEAHRTLVSLARVAVVPLIALAWWFVLPLPGGLALGAEHRAAFAGFLGGNLEMGETPARARLLYWLLGAAPALGGSLALAVGAAASLGALRAPAVRTLWIVVGATVVPVWIHPFFLDRFLVPGLLALALLAPVGWFLWLSAGRVRRTSGIVALGLVLVAPSAAGPTTAARLLGLFDPDAAIAERQAAILRSWQRPDTRPSAGLEAPESAAFLEAIERAVGPDDRFGWLGQSSELSPAAVHLGLLARGGSTERFLADAHRPFDVTPVPVGADPGVGVAGVRELAARFPTVFLTDPPDVKDRASRRFVREAHHRPLIEDLGWSTERVAQIGVSAGDGTTRNVDLFVCRRPQ